MPWPPKQRAAIAATEARKGKSREEIAAFFRAHGYGSGRHLMAAHKKRKR